jgi:hypothetical protein
LSTIPTKDFAGWLPEADPGKRRQELMKMSKKAIFFEFYASDCIFLENLFTLVLRKSKAKTGKSEKKAVKPLF